MAEKHSPLDQFAIERFVEIDIGGIDVSFTNSSTLMVASIALITLLMTLSMRGRRLVPNRWQSIAELSYELVAKMLADTVGSEGRKYFPLIFSLFMFILFCNTLGLIPFSFTVTSHIIVTVAFALVVFVGVTLLGIIRNRLKFLRLFLPAGVPMFLAPILVPIEIISYLARPISLSVRLAANMMAGHTMIHVFGGFIFAMGILGVAPFVFIVLLFGLELIIAILQAYVFTILTCLYLKDAIHPEH